MTRVEIRRARGVEGVEAVHLSDSAGQIAQVDTKTHDVEGSDPDNALNDPLIRYQYSNHLGSAVLETDESGAPISYEEYHPYGTTAYRSTRAGLGLSQKRYRFSGKELDDETGLYYFGARYYAPWLGRWTSSDPGGFVDGLNLYRYCSNNPAGMVDASGMKGGLTVPDKPENIWRAQLDPSRESGEVYETWLRAQRLTFPDGITRRISGGTLQWVYQGGRHHWALDGAELVEEDSYEEGSREAGSGDVPEASGDGESSAPASPAPEGTAASSSEPEAEPTASAPPITQVAPAPDAATRVLQEAARPRSITGARPRGTLHLWSGSGKADAQAAIQRSGSGWMMGDIEGAPTPEHAAAEAEFKSARANAPGGQLPQSEVDRIWGRRSASVVGRGAFSGHPVEAHGTPRPGSIQPRYEWPARSFGGGLAGGLFFGAGLFTAIMGGAIRIQRWPHRWCSAASEKPRAVSSTAPARSSGRPRPWRSEPRQALSSVVQPQRSASASPRRDRSGAATPRAE